MKTSHFAAATLATALAFTGCRPKEASLTEAQQAQIRQEVFRAMEGVIQAEERLDAGAAWAFHAEVPGYFWADADGKVYDFASTRQAWTDYLAGCSRLKFTTRRQELMVLGPDLAYYLWHGAAEGAMKDGSTFRADPWTARYLWRRIGGAWKIAGGAESALPPQTTPPPATAE